MNKKGFTLIELLVVVLIIGILSAVALPQYQKAVTKSRMSSLWPLLKSIKDAQELYYLENGTYVDDLSQLSIGVPKGQIYSNTVVGEEIYSNGLCLNNITANLSLSYGWNIFGGYGGDCSVTSPTKDQKGCYLNYILIIMKKAER